MFIEESKVENTQNIDSKDDSNNHSSLSPDEHQDDMESIPEHHPDELPVPPQSDAEKIKNLTAELESVNAQLTETHDKMLRIAANADNTRKRLEKEKSDAYLYSIQEFAKDMLPVIDAFDKALQTIQQIEANGADHASQMASIVEGVKIVAKVFDSTIKKHGVERLPGKDTPFNPSFHNAIAKEVDSKYENDTVIEEYMTGYKIGERVLRTALVKVGSPD